MSLKGLMRASGQRLAGPAVGVRHDIGEVPIDDVIEGRVEVLVVVRGTDVDDLGVWRHAVNGLDVEGLLAVPALRILAIVLGPAIRAGSDDLAELAGLELRDPALRRPGLDVIDDRRRRVGVDDRDRHVVTSQPGRDAIGAANLLRRVTAGCEGCRVTVDVGQRGPVGGRARVDLVPVGGARRGVHERRRWWCGGRRGRPDERVALVESGDRLDRPGKARRDADVALRRAQGHPAHAVVPEGHVEGSCGLGDRAFGGHVQSVRRRVVDREARTAQPRLDGLDLCLARAIPLPELGRREVLAVRGALGIGNGRSECCRPGRIRPAEIDAETEPVRAGRRGLEVRRLGP